MDKVERLHETVSELPGPEELRQRAQAGWKLAGLVWERQVPARETVHTEDAPYGLKVAGDCRHLEENPSELQVMMAAMEFIVQERPFAQAAEELNRRGFRMRDGSLWNAASVFGLLPRLIEAGPRILSSEDWVSRRHRIFEAQQSAGARAKQ